eukprot:10477024-Alexandrium_andersonii.AAC.1
MAPPPSPAGLPLSEIQPSLCLASPAPARASHSGPPGRGFLRAPDPAQGTVPETCPCAENSLCITFRAAGMQRSSTIAATPRGLMCEASPLRRRLRALPGAPAA